ncbi:MAG TPA: hypothetical protein VFN55_04410 [Solirubrobacteraceae bacterium]|nr:hypothetical protein [Solirubrobacteraceae bacterium]
MRRRALERMLLAMRGCSRLIGAIGVFIAWLAIGAAAASAAPVTISFESGASAGQQVTNEYGPPGTPAGPTFMKSTDAGFTDNGNPEGPNCSPPVLDNTDPAHSGTNSIKLNGCQNGEFWPTATFFALGYSTDSVGFWVSIVAGTGSSHVVTTALDASGNIVDQQVTALPTQAGAYAYAQVTSTTDNIAFVAIEYGEVSQQYGWKLTHVVDTTSTQNLLVDDLTYEPPSSPPASSFRLGASPTAIAAYVGGQATVNLPITWTNNPNPSASPVSLEVSGLPQGVTASLSPNPSTAGSSALTLSVATNAPVPDKPTDITVTGYVDKGLPSQKEASVQISFSEYPAFTIAQPPAVTLAPCTPGQVKLEVDTANTFTQPLTVSVNTADQRAVVITGISGGTVSDPSDASTTVTPSNGVATVTLSLSVPAGTAPAGPAPYFVTAVASGYDLASGPWGKLAIEAGQVDHVIQTGTVFTPTLVSSPALAQPGTEITLRGAGFCPGTGVAIGDPNNVSTATSISSDGTSLNFAVPRGATTGPIHVLPPGGAGFDGPSLAVRTFRNTYGFSWTNDSYGTPWTTDMVDELFGKDETNFLVPPFFFSVRKPEAYLFYGLTSKHISGGLCFGIAYSSLQFFDFPSNTLQFPSTGGTTPWHLDSPTAPSSALLRFVTERFSLQFTDQLIPVALNAAIGIHGPADDLNAIKAELAAGHPVMVGLVKWSGLKVAGHTVLAYDTHPLPDGNTAIDVVNSNVPYSTAEESNPSGHDTAEFTNSQIIYGPDGNWSFPEGKDFQGSNGQPWTGSEADMVVYPHSQLPILNGQRPKLPNVFTATALVVFGSSSDGVAQLSGSGGSLFKGGQLAPQHSWPAGVAPIPGFAGVPRPLQLVSLDPRRAGLLTATVERHPGGGAMNVQLPGLEAALQGGSQKGQVDHVSVNPHTDTIGYRAGAPSPFSGSLLSAPGAQAAAAGPAGELSDRVVQFQTSNSRGGSDTLAFPSGRQLVITHTGSPAALSLKLSAFTAQGLPIAVQLPTVRLVAGEKLKVAPTSWRALGSTTVRLTASVHGRTVVKRVRGRLIGRRFATLTGAHLVPLGGGRYGVALGLRVRRAPSQAWIAIAATLVQGRRQLQRALPVQLSRAALRSGIVHLTLPGKVARGRYALVIRLLETTPAGLAQDSALLTSRVNTTVR